MSIKAEARYFNNAHRISDVALDPGVTALNDGQWLMMNASGNFVIHDGSTNKRAYITLSSKWGNPVLNVNRPITAGPAGRDTVTAVGLATVLIGPYRLATDQYETGTYVPGGGLKVSANGKLTNWVSGTDNAGDIVAYVFAPPATAGAPMSIIHE